MFGYMISFLVAFTIADLGVDVQRNVKERLGLKKEIALERAVD